MSMNLSQHAMGEAAHLDSDTEYLRLLPDLHRLATERLLPINIDVIGLMTKVLGALPHLRALRAQLEAAFASFDARLFDRIESYAVALLKAHAIYNLTSSKAASVLPRVQELRTIRRQLLRADR